MKLAVTVKPGSKKGPFVRQDDGGSLVIYVREPAVDGRANVAVMKLLAGYLGIAKSRIIIKHGQNSRQKTIIIK